MGRAVYLDRDGTIAEDVNYCRRPEDFHLLPRAGAAIALLKRAGLQLIVVTNQSGIARGYFTWETLRQIHDKMQRAIGDGGVDAIYVCPHHPDDGCDCRKPRTGMLRQAAAELDVDLAGSYLVGDRDIDILAGRASGCKTVLVATGPTSSDALMDGTLRPDYHAADLYEAALWIMERNGAGPRSP